MTTTKVEEYLSNVENTIKSLGLEEDEVNKDEIIQVITMSKDPRGINQEKLIKTYIYAYNRLNLKKGYTESFKVAFPERAKVTKDSKSVGRFNIGSKEIGDWLGETTITLKAKNLEKTSNYKLIIGILSTSTYLSYAVERFEVIEAAYEKALSVDVMDRDKAAYMKIFLEETRKPEGSGINVNINSGNSKVHNEVNISTDEIMGRISNMASQIDNISSGDLKNLLANTKESKSPIDAELIEEKKEELSGS